MKLKGRNMEVTDDEVNAFVDLYREETGHQLYRNRTRMGLEQFVANRLENAFQPDIPPHKLLSKRVAGLEKEIVVIHDRNDSNIQKIQALLHELRTKIDTHIHHNDNGFSTGTAIYPVGKREERGRAGLYVQYGAPHLLFPEFRNIHTPDGCDFGVRVERNESLSPNEVMIIMHDGMSIRFSLPTDQG